MNIKDIERLFEEIAAEYEEERENEELGEEFFSRIHDDEEYWKEEDDI